MFKKIQDYYSRLKTSTVDWLFSKETNSLSDQGGYRSGRLDSGNYEHNPPPIGENSAIHQANDLSDRRQRDNYRNVTMAKRAVHVLRDLIVGMGLQCYIDPIQLSLREIVELREDQKRGREKFLDLIDWGLASDDAFMRWAIEPELCDRAGKKTWFEMQRIAIMEEIRVGVCLIGHELVDRGKGISPLRLQMYEKEQIDTTRDRHESKGRKHRVENGFVLDDANRELGVYLFYENPNEWFTPSFGYKSRFVPKSRYHHVFNATQPNQNTGFTWNHTQGQPLRDRDIFVANEMRTGAKQAMQVLVAYLDDPENAEFGMEINDNNPVPRSKPALSHSPIAYKLKAGSKENLEMIETKRPNANANNFFDIIDHEIAMASDLSYPTLHGRFNGHTYEGIRAALQLENVQMKPLQMAFGLQLCLRIRKLHQDFAIMKKEISNGPTISHYMRNKSKFSQFDVVGPGRVLINMEKETDGTSARLRGLLSTYKEALMADGKHWLKTLRQICIENELFNMLSIVPDWSKGQGGQVETNSREESATNDSESNSLEHRISQIENMLQDERFLP